MYDEKELRRAGFTPGEIQKISDAPAAFNLGNWGEAMKSHKEVMDAYFKLRPADTMDDYEKYIYNWYVTVVKEADPWIFIDQFYFKTYLGVTKPRWEKAYKSVAELRKRVSLR